jgi:hypothetical protein
MVLKNLSVGERLGLGFGLIGLLFAIIVWQYHHTLFSVINQFDTLQATQAAKQRHYLNVHRFMLEARRSEKDFLARKEPHYPRRVTEYVDRIEEEIKKIKQIESLASGRPMGEEIHELIQRYHAAFKKIVEAWKINGLDHNSGLQGRFRDTIHTIESQAQNFKTSRLTLTLLQIRRAEKDLGLRKEADYRSQVQSLIKLFRTQLGQSTLDSSIKLKLSKTLSRYQRYFETYADLALDNRDIHGGKGPFRTAAHQLEKQLSQQYVPDLEAEILSLRRREKDYLLRGDNSYVKSVQKIASQILTNIRTSNISEENKNLLISGINRYQSDFLTLVNHNNEIIQLTAHMREAVHKIEPLVTIGVAEAVTEMSIATEATRSQAQNSTAIALLIALFATVLGIGFAAYFSRRITYPVNTLTQLAELFAPPEEDPAARDPGQKDEIVILTNAMGRMTGHLRDIIYYFIDHGKDLKEITTKLEENLDRAISQEEKKEMVVTLKSMSNDLDKKMDQLNV